MDGNPPLDEKAVHYNGDFALLATVFVCFPEILQPFAEKYIPLAPLPLYRQTFIPAYFARACLRLFGRLVVAGITGAFFTDRERAKSCIFLKADRHAIRFRKSRLKNVFRNTARIQWRHEKTAWKMMRLSGCHPIVAESRFGGAFFVKSLLKSKY